MAAEAIRPSRRELAYKFKALAAVPLRWLLLRGAVLLLFNRFLARVLGMVDMGDQREGPTLGRDLRALGLPRRPPRPPRTPLRCLRALLLRL